MRCLASSPPQRHHIKLRTDSAHWRTNQLPYIVGATLAVALLILLILLIPIILLALLILLTLLIPIILLTSIIPVVLIIPLALIILLISLAGTRTSFHSTGSSSSMRLCKRAGST